MGNRMQLAAAVCATGLGLGVVATAFAAEGEQRSSEPRRGGPGPEIELIEREGNELRRAIAEHRIEELSARYRELYAKADDLGVAPRRSVLEAPGEPEVEDLNDAVDELRDEVAEAREAAEAETSGSGGSGDYGLTGGVSQSTLDAIASCESGGDPSAVNAAGYYGKYQFDLGTWQSVGGTGNPAEAPEAEQDMRASMLYARAGSSPWPVCGQ